MFQAIHWRSFVDAASSSHKNDGSDLDFVCEDTCTGSLTLFTCHHSASTDRRTATNYYIAVAMKHEQ